MFKRLIDWLKRIWFDKVEPEAEYMVWDDYEYLRNKYGISQPFAPEEDKCKK